MDPLKDAREIFWAGVGAVDGYGVVKANLELREDSLLVKGEEIPLGRRVFVVGAGKASCWMGKALEEVLGDRIRGGVIVTKYGHRVELERIRVIEAGHPVPDQRGLEGAREVLEVCKGLSEHDLLICLLSGGGSALLPLPQEGLSLRDKQTATELLLHSGARIQELNAIRKHLSGIKGGRLALWAHPARVLTLIISDVVGDELDVIASGPTVPDRSTYADALSVIERYGLREKMPPSVIEILEKGIRGELPETPKPGDPAFGKVKNVILASNLQCLMASEKQARGLGYNTLVLSSMIEGEAREVAKVHAAIAKEVLRSGRPLEPPACLLSGGETTVTVRGEGRGGRNQEFALAFALEVQGWQGILCLSAGTDGTDGPTDAAGAWADSDTVKRAKEKGLEPEEFLQRNDSFTFFEALGQLFFTGPTRTNVMDLRIVMATSGARSA